MSQEPNCKVLIVDDEPLARQYVHALIERDSRFRVVGVCDSGSAAVQFVQQNLVDVIFLDLQMPRMDGFALINALGSNRPIIVLVTAFNGHALRAFECEVFDYITKPIDQARFANVLVRVHRRFEEQNAIAQLPTSSGVPRPHGGNPEASSNRIVLNAVRQDVLCNAEEVQLIEGSGNYITVTVSEIAYLVRSTLEQFSNQLDPLLFLRVHRSFVVNVNCIRRLRYGRSGAAELELTGGQVIPVSRGRRNAVAAAIRARGNSHEPSDSGLDESGQAP